MVWSPLPMEINISGWCEQLLDQNSSLHELLWPDYANALSVTISNKNRTIAIDKNAVGTVHRAFQRIGIPAVPGHSGAGNAADDATASFDQANDVVFSVCEVNVTIGCD